jgi:hypothetical protein
MTEVVTNPADLKSWLDYIVQLPLVGFFVITFWALYTKRLVFGYQLGDLKVEKDKELEKLEKRRVEDCEYRDARIEQLEQQVTDWQSAYQRQSERVTTITSTVAEKVTPGALRP